MRDSGDCSCSSAGRWPGARADHPGSIERFLGKNNTKEDHEYAELNTMYLFVQYFRWVKIPRRHAQFIDPRNNQTNRAYAVLFEAVRDAFADSISIDEPTFRLFRGEQRAR
jgi:hypothetical protein